MTIKILVLILLMMSPVAFIQLGSGSEENREEERDSYNYDNSDERMNEDSSEYTDQHDSPMGEDEILSDPQMGDDNGNSNDNGYDISHDLFEKSLQGTPESVILEIGNVGIEVFLDYILFLEGQGKGGDVLVNPARSYGVGSFSLTEGQSISLDFDDCHNIGCKPPEQIRAVYLVDSDASDIDIVNANLDEGEIVSLEQSETDPFEYEMPAYIKTVTSSNNDSNEDSSYKFVIHTEQKDGIDAFYITTGVEVSTSGVSY